MDNNTTVTIITRDHGHDVLDHDGDTADDGLAVVVKVLDPEEDCVYHSHFICGGSLHHQQAKQTLFKDQSNRTQVQQLSKGM